MVTLRSGALTVEIGLSGAKAFAGQEIGFFAKFKLEPGWHVYGTPFQTRTRPCRSISTIPKIVRQSFELPEARPMEIAALNETLPVYSGSFQGWVRCCSNFQSKRAIPCCLANSVFSSAATPSARRQRLFRSNCR